MTTTVEAIQYQLAEVGFTGLFAWCDSSREKRPGVLVVHGGAGLDDHAKDRAQRISAWGFVTFACDIYGNRVTGNRERIMARIGELRDDRDKLCAAANAGIATLTAHPLVDGRIAAVGYCFGGMTVLELARSGAELKAVASIHGTLSTGWPAEKNSIKAKILVCHGALDPHVPMTQVNEFAEEMNRCAADWQLNIYGGARHGFTHHNASAMPGVAYDAKADARSERTLRDFLDEVFS